MNFINYNIIGQIAVRCITIMYWNECSISQRLVELHVFVPHFEAGRWEEELETVWLNAQAQIVSTPRMLMAIAM